MSEQKRNEVTPLDMAVEKMEIERLKKDLARLSCTSKNGAKDFIAELRRGLGPWYKPGNPESEEQLLVFVVYHLMGEAQLHRRWWALENFNHSATRRYYEAKIKELEASKNV